MGIRVDYADLPVISNLGREVLIKPLCIITLGWWFYPILMSDSLIERISLINSLTSPTPRFPHEHLSSGIVIEEDQM